MNEDLNNVLLRLIQENIQTNAVCLEGEPKRREDGKL